jgi:hypothetical protein
VSKKGNGKIGDPHTEIDVRLEVVGFSYLLSGAGEETIASFCRAAARLYREKPWLVVPDAEDLIAVSIDEIGLSDAVLSVFGQDQQSFGISLFQHLDDFYHFLELDPLDAELADSAVPLLTLTFDPPDDLPPELLEEIVRHRWELGGNEAYPWLMSFREDDHEIRPPTEHELRLAEAVCLALPELLADRETLGEALRGEAPALSRRVRVATDAGDLDVVLSTEIAGQDEIEELARPEHPLLGAFYDLESAEEIELEPRKQLEARMFELFEESAHGQQHPGAPFSRLVLDLAAEHFATTVASLNPVALYELLHELLPADGQVGPEDAGQLVAELRALFSFLAEDLGFAKATLCRDLLDDEAAALLRTALVDYGDA